MPDKTPPLPGWIYYEDGYLGYKMTPDGKNVTPVGAVGEPSIKLHGGYRWILEFRPADPPAFYPNGYPRHDLWAVREDNAAVCVQLTDELDLEPDPDIYSAVGVQQPRKSQDIARWSLDDTKVSFLAKRWEIVESPPGSGFYMFSGDVLEYGIFELDVDWDPATFEPSGTPTDLILDDLPLFDENEPCMGVIDSYFDISQDRLTAIYTLPYEDPDGRRYLHVLYVSEVNDPEAGFDPGVMLVDGDIRKDGPPRLSPEGSKVVFKFTGGLPVYSGNIMSINADGTGLTSIVEPPGIEYHGIGYPRWSPTGTHIVYGFYWMQTKPWYDWFMELHRCEADGGGDKTITNPRKMYPNNLGWRGDD
jgi:hypothetical protein